MRNLRFLTVVLVGLSMTSMAIGQVMFSEDFESYAVGTDLHHVGGWDGWGDAAEASAPVSGDFARSGSKSIKVIDTTDVVQIFDVEGGQWIFTAYVYIPSGGFGTQMFIMLNTYDHANTARDWSIETHFELDTGDITSDFADGVLGTVIFDQWVEVRIVMDLDNNVVDEYYDGERIATHVWDDNNHPTFQCLDLYGNSASPIYYDDITLYRVPNYVAFGPSPADGATGVTLSTLTWEAGDTAVSHNVYFGTSFDEVDAGLMEAVTTTTASLSTDEIPGYAGGLTPGQTYYWRVDEVAADGTEYVGEVWSFEMRPLTAWAPSPADGTQYALTDQQLSWTPGAGALFHTVYFGESFDEVNDATVGQKMTSDLFYDPGTLELDTTYYWRIDEFGAGMITHKGPVWSFKTVGEIPVTDPDMVGWWRLDEGNGTAALDWSGHGNTGTLEGDPEWTFEGHHGGAMDFDGDDYVDFGNPQDWPAGASPRSMCGWGKTDIASGGYRWICAYGTNATSQAMFIGQNGSTLVSGAYGDDVSLTSFWRAGVWHHICLTYDGTTARLYADGLEVGSAAKTWNLTLSRAYIGRQVNNAEYWNGMLDDVRIYQKALTEEEIAAVMGGGPLLASSPSPDSGTIVDIRNATNLTWAAGNTAASHDVYFGTDPAALAMATTTSPEYQGNQSSTSLPLAGMVEFGGGKYCWRIDEVEGDGTVHTGYVWTFAVPDYLIVDDFENYTNSVGERVFEAWVDGIGFTLPAPGSQGNGTGAAVGHDIWSSTSPYYNGLLMETSRPNSGAQAMPLYYDNTAAPYYSEAERTWTTAQNWTIEGVDTLSLWVRGRKANSQEDLYVAVQDSSNHVGVFINPDPAASVVSEWAQWLIPLSDLTDAGVNPAAVKKMYIGVGSRTTPTAGGTGELSIDDIQVIKGQ